MHMKHSALASSSAAQIWPGARQRVSLLTSHRPAGSTPHDQHAVARAASKDATEEGTSSRTAGEGSAPWLLGFQCNERYLQWDDSAQVQLLKIYVARELQQDVPWVEEQLDVLRSILPDLVGHVHKMKATLLLGLVSNRQEIADKMVQLKALLPSLNVSRLVFRCPSLIMFHEVSRLEQNIHKLRVLLPGTDVEHLVDKEPLLLVADVDGLLEEAERLLPAGHDCAAYLAANPGTLLDMQQAGLDSAIDGNLWTDDL